MIDFTKSVIGFIGFGLIGGSIAKVIKEHYPQSVLLAFNYYKNKPNPNLETAKQEGILDSINTDLSSFKHCDIIFLCAPVLKNISYFDQLKDIITSDCILTDVGSVKGIIHKKITQIGLEENFIGGHPMAGSEKTGYQYSSSRLLENAYYILTPAKLVSKQKIEQMTQFVCDMGAIPILLNAEEHDDITAAISHVPHIIASSLVHLVKKYDNEKEQMRSLAAGGFKDITRIASSSSEVWQNICLTNQDSICKFLSFYLDSLTTMLQLLKKQDAAAIYEFFETAKDYRDSIPNKSNGLIKKIYEVYVDIIDETGAIATIATILASNAISIKNIGILHNREFENGVLRIELYEESSAQTAIQLLSQYRYTIYNRE